MRGANQSLERLETEGSCTVEQEKDSWYLSAGLEALKFNEVDVWLEDTNVVSRANSHKLT